MTSSITDGSFVVQPLIVTNYTSARTSSTIVNWVIGKSSPDVILMPGHLRSGSLVAIFDAERAAKDCMDLHATPAVLSFADSDAPTTAMSYVLNGDLGLTQDQQSGRYWAVTIPYQEVTA